MANHISQFFYMHGYGKYIFSSYSLVIAVLMIQIIPPINRWRQYVRKAHHE